MRRSEATEARLDIERESSPTTFLSSKVQQLIFTKDRSSSFNPPLSSPSSYRDSSYPPSTWIGIRSSRTRSGYLPTAFAGHRNRESTGMLLQAPPIRPISRYHPLQPLVESYSVLKFHDLPIRHDSTCCHQICSTSS